MYRKLLLNKLLFFVFAIFLSSCYKNRLKDDTELFIGEWEWAYSVREIPCGCGDPPDYDTLKPLTEGDTYKMEFKKKGKIFFYKNDEIINKKRIVFYKWPDKNIWLTSSNQRIFGIKLNNNKDSILEGNIDSQDMYGIKDSIEFYRYFPFKNEFKHGVYISYRHLFIKR